MHGANESPPTNGHEVLYRIADRRGMPLTAHLQVADRCNHACVHCYQVQGEKGELTLDELQGVLERLARSGVLILNVSGGEATLRPDLVDILRRARALGFALRLYTNAFGLTPELAASLAQVGLLEVHVSVYSDRDDEHDAVTRVPGSLAKTLRGIRLMRERNVRVCIKSPALKLARGATSRLEQLARELGCAFESSSDITPREDGALETMDTGLAGEDVVALGLAEPWLPADDDGPRRAAKLAAASCGACTTGTTVLPNGDVLACTDTPVVLGNLAQTGLDEIYQSNPEVPLFRELSWGHVHGCRSCDLLLACSRCHATALRQGGDYLGPYAQGCDRARARYAAGVGHALTVLEPDASCGEGRARELGPYRIESPGVLRPLPDERNESDEARAARHPWLRGRETNQATLVPVENLRRRVRASSPT